MSADEARRGFIFQDRYLLWRILQEAGSDLERRLDETVSPTTTIRFGVEARPAHLQASGTDDPAWDVVTLRQNELEVIEVKSGAIRRADRKAFWCRLRALMSSRWETDTRLIPMLVADPFRASGLERWEQMASMAAGAPVRLPRSRLSNGGTASKLLDEALWHLCVDRTDNAPRVSKAAALAVLGRLRVDRHPAEALEQSVARGIEVLFADGLTEQIENNILGWLNRRAISREPGGRFLTVRDMLNEMSLSEASARLAPGSLEQWRALWHDLPRLFDERAQVSLGRGGPSLDALRTQPSAMAQLNSSKRYVLVGEAGTGKTAFLRQWAEREGTGGAEVFRVAADSVVDAEQLRSLFGSLRFKRALRSLRTPEQSFWLGVDGLDEVNDAVLQGQWARSLAQFAGSSQQTVVAVSVRHSVWQDRAALHPHLDSFTLLPIEDWPDELVRESLVDIPGGERVSASLLALLRRPLFLDLFRRIYAAAEPAHDPHDLHDALTVKSRHDLLDRFWTERVLRSRRPRAIQFSACLGEVLRVAASGIGGFDSSLLDQPTVALLVSEGVLVAEGEHACRHRFRHPLLRDHALAFWCLGAGSASGLVERLHSIRGGLQTQGALRAVFEALLADSAEAKHPSVEFREVVVAICDQPESARLLARLLGTLTPTPSMNPATWPARAYAALPGGFGRELITVAHAEKNGGWAQAIQHWSPDAPWLDEGFFAALCNYTTALFHLSNRQVLANAGERGSAEQAALQDARMAAGKLRALIGHERFAAVTERDNRHLQASALELIIRLLPDEQTFAVVEAELSAPPFPRTSTTILEGMPSLTAFDPVRAAAFFKHLIGLRNVNGSPMLDPTRWWPGILERLAVGGVLGGEMGSESVLAAHPRVWMPVALDLAEALSAADDLLRDAHALWDGPLYRHNFWDDDHHDRAPDRCLRAIRHACGRIVDSDPARYLSEIAPLLQSSSSAAVQSVHLDVLAARSGDAAYSAAFHASLFDTRFYRAPLLLYWLEEALRRYWPTLDAVERAQVLALIDAIAADSPADPTANYRRAQLLATVPTHDLTEPRLRNLAAPQANPYHATPHPRTPVFSHSDTQHFGNTSDTPDAWRVADWPPEFAADSLLALSAGGRLLDGNDPPEAALHQYLPSMIAAAGALLPALASQHGMLAEARRQWMWEALTICMEKSHVDRVAIEPPTPAVIGACARLALDVLEEGAPAASNETRDTAIFAVLGTSWDKALQLADAALIWPSSQEDSAIQERFERVWRNIFAANSPAARIAFTQGVRPYHWLRDEARRRLDEELVWQSERHGAVLAASVTRLRCMDEARQTRLARQLLARHPATHSSTLAEAVGRWMGHAAMEVRPSGRRHAVAALVDEVVHAPQQWALLSDPAICRAFLHWLAIGMQQTAGRRWSQAQQLAADYGRWNLALWRAVRTVGGENEEREIVAIPLFWLPQHLPAVPPVVRDPATLRIWWAELQHFCTRLVEEGTIDDVNHLFHHLQPGRMNHVLQATQVFAWVGTLLDRLEAGMVSQTMFLDAPPGGLRHQGWREVLCHACQALDCLRVDNLLLTEQHRETAFRLLDRLASAPFGLDLALHVMQSFRRTQL